MAEKRCVILGAGMSGLTAGKVLAGHGWSVTLLDKGRGPGGRMSTRLSELGQADHGAQFFTAKTPEFAGMVNEWVSAGLARSWFSLNGHERWIGVAGMSSITRHLAAGLDVKTGVQVTSVDWDGDAWVLREETGSLWHSPVIILTAPVPQSLALVSNRLVDPPRVEYARCIAILVWLDGASRVPPPGYVRPGNSVLMWIADNLQKGICSGPGTPLTIHATPDWSKVNWDRPSEEIAASLLRDAEPWLGSRIVQWSVHKWKYAVPYETQEEACFIRRELGLLVIAGDAFGEPRVEGAWLSGHAAARAVLAGS